MSSFLIPASAPRLVSQRPWYVLSSLWDDAYKRILAANRKLKERERVLRILKQFIVKPTEVVDIKVWCNNRYGVLTCPHKLNAYKYPKYVMFM